MPMATHATQSLCPECKALVPADVVEDEGRVVMVKQCPEHGEHRALTCSDAEGYISGEADPVRVHDGVADAAALRHASHDLAEVGVNRRLSARQHHDIGRTTFGARDRIEHRMYVIE